MSSNKARGSLHHKTQERCLHAELHRGGLWPTGMHCPFSKSQLRTTRASVVGTPRSADYPNNFVCYRAWAICQASPVGKLRQAAGGCVEPHPGTHHYLEQTQKGAAQSAHSVFDTGNGCGRVKHPESRGPRDKDSLTLQSPCRVCTKRLQDSL